MAEPTRVWNGVRRRALAMAQAAFPTPPPANAIWLDCTGCDQSIILYFADTEAARATNDAEAAGYFHTHGWRIRPTLCPACKARQDNPIAPRLSRRVRQVTTLQEVVVIEGFEFEVELIEALLSVDGGSGALVIYDDKQQEALEARGLIQTNARHGCYASQKLRDLWKSDQEATHGDGPLFQRA